MIKLATVPFLIFGAIHNRRHFFLSDFFRRSFLSQHLYYFYPLGDLKDILTLFAPPPRITDVFYGWTLRFFTYVRESESRRDRQNHVTKVATLLFSMTSVVKFRGHGSTGLTELCSKINCRFFFYFDWLSNELSKIGHDVWKQSS